MAPEWVMPAVKTFVFAADCALAAGCFLLAFHLREGKPIFSETAWAWSKEFVPYAGIFFSVIPIRASMMLYERAYRFSGAFSYASELIKVFKAILVGSLLIVAVAFLFRGGFAFRDFSYSRAVFVVDFALALVSYSIFHLSIRYVQVRFRRRGVNLIPTLIIGSSVQAEQTRAELAAAPELGYDVLGVIAEVSDLPDAVREYAIQEVVITDDRITSDDLFEAMMRIDRSRRVEFRFAPSVFNLLPQKTEVEQIGILPVVTLFQEPLSGLERFVKRATDLAVSAAALIIAGPLIALASAAIRLNSRGPVFFRQERVGMDGRVFLCYKFRTMDADADEAVHREAYLKNIEGSLEAADGDEPVFGKVRDDPRITRVGRLLRRSSLDELPQFWNVLKGDMSVVGPRPPIPYEVENYDARHRRRLDMKPGITGLWQVSGRNRLSFEEMVGIDLYYIENWSVWLDLKVVLLTLPAIFKGH
jgi:exopolysaccharide biosynthesis polyprenyl glycosylphosphotransferase